MGCTLSFAEERLTARFTTKSTFSCHFREGAAVRGTFIGCLLSSVVTPLKNGVHLQASKNKMDTDLHRYDEHSALNTGLGCLTE
jgi:hypothetical protein